MRHCTCLRLASMVSTRARHMAAILRKVETADGGGNRRRRSCISAREVFGTAKCHRSFARHWGASARHSFAVCPDACTFSSSVPLMGPPVAA
eukprot:4630984-Pyramimonas_sp.AAC.1